MATEIKFGTDGWRGIIAEDYTFDNVRICAQAIANYLKESGKAGDGLVVGYDFRFASEQFAAAVGEVGHFINQLQMYALLFLYLLEVRGMRGPAVRTVTSTVMADNLGKLYGVPVYETAVGLAWFTAGARWGYSGGRARVPPEL